MRKTRLLSLLPLPLALACAFGCVEVHSPGNGDGKASRKAFPTCLRGTFAAELDDLIPPLSPVRPVTLFPVKSINRRIEPGCIVPFRDEPGQEALVDVGRVVVKSTKRNMPKPKGEQLGRGRLQIGRGQLRLTLLNDAGDEFWELRVEHRHVVFKRKGAAAFDEDIGLDDATPLPLPFDALVNALERCDDDERLGITEEGNVVEARRRSVPLWRSRWLQLDGNAAVDTSVMCGPNDARLAWRTSAGDVLPMLLVISARSDRTLLISRQPPSDTDDWTDPGMGAGSGAGVR